MTKGKGIGPAPIIAVALVSTVVTIFLDHVGVTKKVENIVKGMTRG